jgi:hypothetical protein
MNFNHARADNSIRGNYMCVCGEGYSKSKWLSNHITYEKKLHLQALQRIQDAAAAAAAALTGVASIDPPSVSVDAAGIQFEQADEVDPVRQRQNECK